jgi:glycosyltransferase involved in cell wall biosynthesis
MKLLSIITPSLADPSDFIKNLQETLNYRGHSKDFENKFEILIVSPSSDEWMRKNEFSSVRYIEDTNQGIYHALNLGVRASEGLYILVVNIDDQINISDVLETLAQVDRHNIVVYGDTFIHDDVSELIISVPGAKKPNTIDQLRMPGSHQSQLIPRTEFFKLEGFSLKLKIGRLSFKLKYASDFDFYCRSFLSGTSWVYESKLVAHQKLGGTTSRHWLRTTIEILVIHWFHSNSFLPNINLWAKTLAGATRFHFPRQQARK